jgi:hypothetical protein
VAIKNNCLNLLLWQRLQLHLMVCKETLFSDYAITQMFKRNITVDNVKFIVESGEVITTYSYDKPFIPVI